MTSACWSKLHTAGEHESKTSKPTCRQCRRKRRKLTYFWTLQFASGAMAPRSPARLSIAEQMTQKRSACWKKLRRGWIKRTSAAEMVKEWTPTNHVRAINVPIPVLPVQLQGSFNAREEERLKRLHEMVASSAPVMIAEFAECWAGWLELNQTGGFEDAMGGTKWR